MVTVYLVCARQNMLSVLINTSHIIWLKIKKFSTVSVWRFPEKDYTRGSITLLNFFLMGNKKIVLGVGALVLVLIITTLGIFLYYRGARVQKAQVDEKQTVRDLQTSVENVTSQPRVDVPSANPAQKVLPQENPLEKTNPFKDEYQNPFK